MTFLVVLAHGLWGNKGHMKYIETEIEKKYKDQSVHVLNSSVNESKYSYDGIDICGERLANEIEERIRKIEKEGKKVEKIGLIGYSLGGLIIRYTIGILGHRGLFETIEPKYVVTFATPHMGVKLPSKSIMAHLFKFFSGTMVSRSGEQLQLKDTDREKPLLEIMSDPNSIFFNYLSRFETIRTYANISNDRTVPYWSSGIELKDYFYDRQGKLEIKLDERYESIAKEFEVRQIPRTPPIKKRLIRYSLYFLIPMLAPLWLVLIFSVIGTQGLMSRLRVKGILNDQDPLMGSSTTVNEDWVVDTIDLGPSLESISKPLEFDPVTIQIQKNLSRLRWERIWVHIKEFNSHGSIVCRQKRFTNPGGMATVQHFIDTTHFE